MKNEKQKEIRYFSMFTGVGGFELGIERVSSSQPLSEKWKSETGRNRTSNEQGTCVRSGSIPTLFTPIGFSEIDKYASELLKNKFPNIKNYGDATKIIPEELPDFDLLVGGFPCQAFSIAGKRRGFEDTRGTLFYDIARILKVKRPEYILLENVKGLLSHDQGRTFGTIIAILSELGYVVQWMVLNSKFFGVPQNRERVFIIGSLRGKSIPEILPLRINSKQIKENNETKGHFFDGAGKQEVSTAIDQNYWKGFGARGKSRGRTMVNNDTKIRRLTPTECERLQGFPDGWTEGFSDTQRYKMMGNAVTVNVIKAVIGEMFK